MEQWNRRAIPKDWPFLFFWRSFRRREPCVEVGESRRGCWCILRLPDVYKRQVVYLPRADAVPSAAAIAGVKAQFPGLTWVDDPTEAPVNYLVTQESGGWKAYGQTGKAVKPGPAAKGAAFMLLGPPPSVADRIRRTEPFKRNAFRFTDNLSESSYFLTMRVRKDGTPEYALFDPRVLAEHKDTDVYKRQMGDDAP